ncbi:MAG: class I SAM-dependent methyltransferase [Candidatus Binatia bacterium]
MKESEAKQKEQVAAVFGRAAPTYDRTGRFAYFGRRLVAAVNLAPGARVLDVASGRGAVLFPAAELVGSHGKVTGIDLSEPMVKATTAGIQRRGLTQAEIFCVDAEQLTFEPASFDAVLCGFSIQYFPRLEETFSKFRRMLRSGGVFALSTWGQGDSRWTRLQELRRSYGVGERMGGIRLRRPAEVESVLRKSGFEPVDVWADEAEFTFKSEAEWWEDLWSSGPRAGLEQLDSDTRARFQREAFERLQGLRGPNGFAERRQAILARGVNP